MCLLQEPSAGKEPSANKEPSAPSKPVADEKPVVSATAKKADKPASALGASGTGKRRASHPMTTPASVDDEFVDVKLTAKSDDSRPAVTVCGKTANMAQVSARASAPTTLPGSVD